MSCAKIILQTLPKQVLSTLSAISTTAVANLQIVRAKEAAYAQYMDIQLIPLKAKSAVLSKTIGTIRSSTSIVPADSIHECPDLGNINTMLEQSIVVSIEHAVDTSLQIDRAMSLQAEANARIGDIDAALDFFQSLIGDINGVLAT